MTIDGRSTVGLVDLSGSPGSIKPLTPERKLALGKAFEAALIPAKIGAKVPISVIVSRADGSTQNVNQDARLYVDSTLASLKFDRSGFLTIRETPGMPKIDPGDILTLYLFFFPDHDNHEHFGYDELYITATKYRASSGSLFDHSAVGRVPLRLASGTTPSFRAGTAGVPRRHVGGLRTSPCQTHGSTAGIRSDTATR